MHWRLLTFEMELKELLLGRLLLIAGDCRELLRTKGLLEVPVIDDKAELLLYDGVGVTTVILLIEDTKHQCV